LDSVSPSIFTRNSAAKRKGNIHSANVSPLGTTVSSLRGMDSQQSFGTFALTAGALDGDFAPAADEISVLTTDNDDDSALVYADNGTSLAISPLLGSK
jgi:hypothetical protein